MRTSRGITVCALTAITISLVNVRIAFAIAGSLKSAGVAFATDYPDEARQEVRAALQREDCKFLRGSFVNWHTSLFYEGDAVALSRSIKDLVKCPEVTVTVGFSKLEEDCDWAIAHDAETNSFQIRVNLNSKRVDLERLVLPATKGPKL